MRWCKTHIKSKQANQKRGLNNTYKPLFKIGKRMGSDWFFSKNSFKKLLTFKFEINILLTY